MLALFLVYIRSRIADLVTLSQKTEAMKKILCVVGLLGLMSCEAIGLKKCYTCTIKTVFNNNRGQAPTVTETKEDVCGVSKMKDLQNTTGSTTTTTGNITITAYRVVSCDQK
jgi:hypothetical protein